MTRAYSVVYNASSCVYSYVSPETAFALPGSPDNIQWVQRRVLQSVLIWTARWSLSLTQSSLLSFLEFLGLLVLGTSDRDVLIISPTPMTCDFFVLRIRYADVISVSINRSIQQACTGRCLPPRTRRITTHTMSR